MSVRKEFIRVSIVSCLIALAFTACSNRGTNKPNGSVDENWGVISGTGANHVYPFPGLFYQPRNPNGFQLMSIYVPKEEFQGADPLPALVLLPPAFGSQDYYFERGLYELAQDMIEKGEIEPMMIVCLASDRSFGSFFYGNSIVAGFYDSIMGTQLLDELAQFRGFQIKPGARFRGIGGIGIGGYGAYRAAIKHPGIWGSVSSNDGPLDFDGANGSSGLISLMDDCVAEQPAGTASFFDRFDTNATKPITTLFIGGSYAFSPHDTNATLKDSVRNRLDTINGVIVTIPQVLTVSITNRQVNPDSTTLVDSLYNGGTLGRFDMHLPFDSLGSPYGPIWNRWLDNDLARLHDAAGTPLTGVRMWCASTDEATLGFYDMTQSWVSKLQGAYGGNVTLHTYRGYPGKPAQTDEYVYDLMREMLKFHSNVFSGN